MKSAAAPGMSFYMSFSLSEEYNGLCPQGPKGEKSMDYEHHLQIKILLDEREEERLKELTANYKDRVKHPVTEDYVLQRMIENYLTRILAGPGKSD